MTRNVTVLALLVSAFCICSGTAGKILTTGLNESQIYVPESGEVYIGGDLSPTEQDEFSFIMGFHDIVLAVGTFQHSLTFPLSQLIEDPSARQGILICKLSRSRMILSAAVNELLESFHHWANIGTSLEEPHCRTDAREALVIFMTAVDKAAKDLDGLDSAGLGNGLTSPSPNAAMDSLLKVVVKILSQFV